MDVVDLVLRIKSLRNEAPDRPWLVVGKGPSAEWVPSHAATLAERCHVITLNHACRVITPTIAHFVDWDAVLDCRGQFSKVSDIATPWHPHIAFKPTAWTASFLAARDGICQARAWCCYNVNNRLSQHPRLKRLSLRAFSATAVFHALALANIRMIFSAGIDGGVHYAKWCDPRTRLANGQPSFDSQTPHLLQRCKSHSIEWVQLRGPDDPRLHRN